MGEAAPTVVAACGAGPSLMPTGGRRAGAVACRPAGSSFQEIARRPGGDAGPLEPGKISVECRPPSPGPARAGAHGTGGSERDAPADREHSTRPVDDDLRQVGAEPGAVVEHLPAQSVDVASVEMADDRRRLIRDAGARREHGEERSEVVAPARARPRTDRGVEAADGVEEARAERHVRARPEDAGGVRKEEPGGTIGMRVEHARLIALVEPHAILEPDLGTCLELRRRNQTRHAHDVLTPRERPGELEQPTLVDEDVVVRERDDLAARNVKAGVVGDREPGPGLVDVTQTLVARRQAFDELPRCRGHGVVVDHDDLVVGVADRTDGVEGRGEPRRSPACGDHDRDRRLRRGRDSSRRPSADSIAPPSALHARSRSAATSNGDPSRARGLPPARRAPVRVRGFGGTPAR